ncbi:MAG: DUF3089 domain-containing protein [Sphingomicrobium sp.]
MCARRFLFVVFLLTLLVVAGAVAIFQFGDKVLIRSATPTGHFTAPPVDSGPDYASDVSWLARPAMADDPSRWLPDGFAATADAPAAIFYIHPTTYLERDHWNAPLSGNRDSDYRAGLFVQSQASALTSAGRVWAPRYRQAAFGAFLLKDQDATAALDLAYGDVRAAFDAFVKQVPPNQPIILAGHSQGALHLMRLLKERVAGTPLQKRIAAAYVVGWPLSVAADVPALGLPVCTAPDQASCLLSWLSFAAPANPELVTDAYQGSAGLAGGTRQRGDILCVNPLTGTRDGAARPEANPGTLVPSADLASATLAAGQVGAHCDNGLLILDGAIPALGPFVLPGNNYHVYDYALFWGAIRADAARRVAAWRP